MGLVSVSKATNSPGSIPLHERMSPVFHGQSVAPRLVVKSGDEQATFKVGTFWPQHHVRFWH